MLQLVGSPVVVLGPPFLHSPLPDGAVTLVVVETALVTPALAAVVDSRITSPEKASSAARRRDTFSQHARLGKAQHKVPQCIRSRTVQSHRRRRRRSSTNPWSPTPVGT